MSLLALALLAALQAPGTAPVRSAWDSFGPGSTAVTVDRPLAGTPFSTTTDVLKSRRDDGLPQIESTRGSRSGHVEISVGTGDNVHVKPFAEGLKEISRRRETLTIKERRLDCDVVTYAGAEDSPKRMRLTVWLAAGLSLPVRRFWGLEAFYDVPASAVRIEVSLEQPSRKSVATLEVLDLNQARTVNGVALDCVEQQIRSLVSVPGGTSCVRGRHEWLSAAVPGALVRCERECGTMERSGTTVTELIDFQVAR